MDIGPGVTFHSQFDARAILEPGRGVSDDLINERYPNSNEDEQDEYDAAALENLNMGLEEEFGPLVSPPPEEETQVIPYTPLIDRVVTTMTAEVESSSQRTNVIGDPSAHIRLYSVWNDNDYTLGGSLDDFIKRMWAPQSERAKENVVNRARKYTKDISSVCATFSALFENRMGRRDDEITYLLAQVQDLLDRIYLCVDAHDPPRRTPITSMITRSDAIYEALGRLGSKMYMRYIELRSGLQSKTTKQIWFTTLTLCRHIILKMRAKRVSGPSPTAEPMKWFLERYTRYSCGELLHKDNWDPVDIIQLSYWLTLDHLWFPDTNALVPQGVDSPPMPPLVEGEDDANGAISLGGGYDDEDDDNTPNIDEKGKKLKMLGLYDMKIADMDPAQLQKLLDHIRTENVNITWSCNAEMAAVFIWYRMGEFLYESHGTDANDRTSRALKRCRDAMPTLFEPAPGRPNEEPTYYLSSDYIYSIESRLCHILEAIQSHWRYAIEAYGMCGMAPSLDCPRGVADHVSPRESFTGQEAAGAPARELDAKSYKDLSYDIYEVYQETIFDVLWLNQTTQESLIADARKLAYQQFIEPGDHEHFVMCHPGQSSTPKDVLHAKSLEWYGPSIGCIMLSDFPRLAFAVSLMGQHNKELEKLATVETIGREYKGYATRLGPLIHRAVFRTLARALSHRILAGTAGPLDSTDDGNSQRSWDVTKESLRSIMTHKIHEAQINELRRNVELARSMTKSGTSKRRTLQNNLLSATDPECSDLAAYNADQINTWFVLETDCITRVFRPHAIANATDALPAIISIRGEFWVVHVGFFFRTRYILKALEVFVRRIAYVAPKYYKRIIPKEYINVFSLECEQGKLYREIVLEEARRKNM